MGKINNKKSKTGFSSGFEMARLRRFGPFMLAGLVTLLIAALYLDNHRLLATWELGIQDAMVSLGRKPTPPSDVVIISIDDEAVESLGSWPWDAERVGYLVGMLGEYQPKAIGLDFELSEDATTDVVGNAFLADMIARTGDVILPIRFTLGGGVPRGDETKDYILKSSLVTFDRAVELMEFPYPQSRRMSTAYESACVAALGLGQINTWQDVDGKVRRDPLVVKFEGDYYPSMALQLARVARGLNRAQVRIEPTEGIYLGSTLIPVDNAGMMLIDYRGPAGTFRSISAAHILEGVAKQNQIEGKIVLVGVTASGYGTTLRTPASPEMPRTEKIATVVSNILSDRFIASVELSTFIDLLVFIAIAAFCAFVLPRATLMYRIVMLVVLTMLFVNLNYILYNSFQLVTNTLYPTLQLLLFLALSPVMKPWVQTEELESARGSNRAGKKQPDVLKTGSGPVFEATVAAELASAPVRVIRPQGPMAAISGLERTAEIRTQAMDASGPTGQAPMRPAPVDISSSPTVEVERASDLMQSAPRPIGVDGSSGGVSDGIVTGSGHLKSGRLGRYEILEVLGEGAMGTVYKGKDPAIDRTIALKTIRAGVGIDPEKAEELRERLVREAKAAGKLSHPNIVTIFDVGAEGELRYIAMEYLEGYTLEQVIKKKVQLNYRIAAKIITQVCNALEYAHKAGIVHRDIKPANIMVLDNFEIKVTDFGIARFDSPQMSMTQTGIAMGTPHYISPEQLRGEPVDRRCDIFSLGVVAYELLTRTRPFAGENMSQLIYSITQSDPKPPSAIDSNIPGLFDIVIRKALAKDPLERYQTADQMGQALSAFTQEMATSSYRL